MINPSIVLRWRRIRWGRREFDMFEYKMWVLEVKNGGCGKGNGVYVYEVEGTVVQLIFWNNRTIGNAGGFSQCIEIWRKASPRFYCTKSRWKILWYSSSPMELSCRLEAGGCPVRASPGRLGSLAQPQRRGTSPWSVSSGQYFGPRCGALCPERGGEEAGCRRVLASLYREGPSELPHRRSSSSAPRRDSTEPRPRGCSVLGEPPQALPSF